MITDFVKIAHRGFSGSYPENTRVAFEKAIETGVDVIEVDCQLSKDGHVVVIHDERLQRTAGERGLVKGKTLDQLKKLDVGKWFKKSFKGQRILALEEVVEIVNGKADLYLDIKTAPHGPLGIELKMLFILSHYDYLDRAIFSSFDYHTLRRVREMAPDVRIGVLYAKRQREDPFQAAAELQAYSLQVQKELVTPELLGKAGELGLKTFVWTVNDLSEMRKFLALGVDGIISDFPQKFCKVKPRGKTSRGRKA